MSNSATRSVEMAGSAPRRLDFHDRARIVLRNDALDRLADAAHDITRNPDGSPRVSALIRRRGAQSAEFRRGEHLEFPLLARVLYLHAQRRGVTPGEAFNDLFEIHVDHVAETATA